MNNYELKIENESDINNFQLSIFNFQLKSVELQGIEPWSKHTRHKLSTCLFWH